MSKVHAVLLVPAEGDRLGLLAEGVGGSSPPVAWLDDGEWVGGCPPEQESDYETGYFDPPCEVALVLAWGGEVVRVGLFTLNEHTSQPDFGTMAHGVRCILAGKPRGSAWAVVRLSELGTIVLLDEDGNEVTP